LISEPPTAAEPLPEVLCGDCGAVVIQRGVRAGDVDLSRRDTLRDSRKTGSPPVGPAS
jgi:hypothetical protein